MKNLRIVTLIPVMVLFTFSCGTTTTITGSYVAPGVNKLAYKKLFVSALTDNTAAKESVESDMSNYLASKNIDAVKSINVFPPEFHSSGSDKDKDMVLQKIRATNCDAILTIALVNKQTVTMYQPGTIYPGAGVAYYGTFGAYYGYGYGSFYSPGYYTTDKTYYLETNLYDAATEKLVWSAQSKTYNPSSLDSFLAGYEKAITQQVIKDGLVEPRK